MDVKYEWVGQVVKVGQGDKWMEILGCGMVYLNVICNCGFDLDEYQGFVFGMGIDCLVMLKYGMLDLCFYFEVDVVWICYYGFKLWLMLSISGGLSQWVRM